MPEQDNQPIFDGCRGAVSLTFDDGTTNQLEKALPGLDARDLRATFYLNPRDRVIERHAEDWRMVAQRGHEIGNHTLSHPCPTAITGGPGLEDMTLDEIAADIAAAQQRLKVIAPHQKAWTFAYPCYSTYVGRGRNRRSYVPVVAGQFLAARAGGEYGFANHPDRADLAALLGTPVERMTVAETVDLIKRLTRTGHWVILVFHDVDGDVLSVALDDYLAILDYLSDNRQAILTATVAEVAAMISSTQHTL